MAGPTPGESARLILKLYELRREPVLREARAWLLRDFNPTTAEECLAVAGGERNAWFRMVLVPLELDSAISWQNIFDRLGFALCLCSSEGNSKSVQLPCLVPAAPG